MSITKCGKKLLCLVLTLAAFFGLVACTITTTDSPLDKAEEAAIANVQTVYEKINWDVTAMEGITSNLTLVTANKNYPDVKIEWSSSQPDVISDEGVVTRLNEDDQRAYEVTKQSGDTQTTYKVIDVVLTATIYSTYTATGEAVYETEKVTKQFKFSVKCIPAGTYFGTIAEVKAAAWNYIYTGEGAVAKQLVTNSNRVFNGMTVGAVTAKLAGSTSGYFINDGTDGIYVFDSNEDLEIGDVVTVIGGIYTYYGSIQFGSDITATPTEESVTPAEAVHYTCEELNALYAPDAEGNYADSAIGYMSGKNVEVEGYLRNKADKASAVSSSNTYCLEDAKTGEEIWLYYKAYGTETAEVLAANVGNYVKVSAVVYDRHSGLGKTEILITSDPVVTEVPQVSDQEKATVAANGLYVAEKVDATFTLPTPTEGTVTWEVVEGTTLTIKDGKAIYAGADTETTVILKATVTVGAASVSKEFTVTVAKVATDLYVAKNVSEMAAGTYKFVINQVKLGKDLYLTSELNSYGAFVCSEKLADAADFVVEAVEGGYTIKVDGLYLEMYENTTYCNMRFVETSTFVWTWNDTYKSFVGTMNGENVKGAYYFGAYNTKTTAATSKTSYITESNLQVTQFPIHAATLYPADYKFVADEAAATEAKTYKFALYQSNLNKWLYATAELNSKTYFVTTEKADEAAEFVVTPVEGGYTITIDGKYVELFETEGTNYVDIRFAETQTGLWQWNETYKTYTYALTGCAKESNNQTYYVGTYNKNTTFGPSKLSFAVSSFVGTFGEAVVTEIEYKADENAATQATTYKFAVYQGTLNKWLYATAELNSKTYFVTTEKVSEAAEFVVTPVEGGYTITIDGKYVELFETEGTNYVDIRFAETQTGLWQWNETYKTYTYALTGCAKESNNQTYYVGTYNKNTTFGPSKLSFADSSFVGTFGNFAFVEEGEPSSDEYTISVAGDSSANATVTLSATKGANGSTFTFTVAANAGYTVKSVTVNGVVVEAVSGTYTATIDGATTVKVETEEVPPYTPEHAGTEADPYSVKDAVNVYTTATLESGKFSAEQVYVKGYVKAITNTTYAKNISLVDKMGDEVSFFCYSANYTETVTTACVGDLIVLKGYICNYSGTIEMTNQTVESVKIYPTFVYREIGTYSITVATDSSENATVNLSATSGKNGSTVTFTVAANAGYNIKSVAVNGKEVEAVEGTYTATINGPTTVKVVTESAGQTQLKAAATFELGNGPDKANDGHVDGSEITTYTETSGDYTLTLTNLSKVYGKAQDAKKNGGLKLGTKSVVGTFTFTVGADVKKVVVYVAGYKAADGAITVNGGTATTITKHSDDGAYYALEIDTTETKTITIATSSSVCRAMVNSIVFYVEDK